MSSACIATPSPNDPEQGILSQAPGWSSSWEQPDYPDRSTGRTSGRRSGGGWVGNGFTGRLKARSFVLACPVAGNALAALCSPSQNRSSGTGRLITGWAPSGSAPAD